MDSSLRSDAQEGLSGPQNVAHSYVCLFGDGVYFTQFGRLSYARVLENPIEYVRILYRISGKLPAMMTIIQHQNYFTSFTHRTE
jgi:hypothetical protein